MTNAKNQSQVASSYHGKGFAHAVGRQLTWQESWKVNDQRFKTKRSKDCDLVQLQQIVTICVMVVAAGSSYFQVRAVFVVLSFIFDERQGFSGI